MVRFEKAPRKFPVPKLNQTFSQTAFSVNSGVEMIP